MLGDINDYRNKFGGGEPFPIVITPEGCGDIKKALGALDNYLTDALEKFGKTSVRTLEAMHYLRVVKEGIETEIARLKAENARLMISGRTHLQQSEHFQKKWDEALKENARLEAALTGNPKKVRTLVRVLSVNGEWVDLLVPAWNSAKHFTFRRALFPMDIKIKIAPGMRLHAQANLGAQIPKDLDLTDWDWPSG